MSQFLVWAVSTALYLDSHCYVADLGETCDESFTSKLLRWLVASVILERVSSKQEDNSSFGTARTSMLDSMLSFMKQFRLENRDARNMSGSEETLGLLAAVIFHLQLLLGAKCRVLSSVVAALSILLRDISYLKGMYLSINYLASSINENGSSLFLSSFFEYSLAYYIS